MIVGLFRTQDRLLGGCIRVHWSSGNDAATILHTGTTDPQATVLGRAQWQWLEQELSKPADVRLVFSSIQVLTQAHGFEKWANFSAERKRLLALLGQAGNAVLFSGDRHQAGVYHDPESGLWELTSSSLNLGLPGSRSEVDPMRTQDLFPGENYAVIDIDWSARALHLQLRKSADGSEIGTPQTVPMRNR